MTFDPRTLVGTPSHWFEARVRYEGTARAEFANPPGVIMGPATVSIDSAGKARVRLTVERIEAPDEKTFALEFGSAPAGQFLVNGMGNPCRSLTVTTASGVFTGGDRILQQGLSIGSRSEVDLCPLHSRFDVTGAASPKFWVLPLLNFLPEVWKGEFFPQLAGHPLRMVTFPSLPEGLSGEEQQLASAYLRDRARLYTFMLNGEPGFIERVPNYRARARLVRRRRSRRMTAVIVGPAHVQDVLWSDYAGLFPIDVVSALTLATGVPVGAPWIEFRDEQGALIRRIHIRFGGVPYERRHATLHPYLLGNNGPGYLIGKVLASSERGQKYLRVAISHALAAAKHGSVESRFISLCRAFETLCRHYGFISQNLAARLESQQQVAVKKLLSDVADQIQAMRNIESDPRRRAAFDSIAGRARSAAQTEKSFGMAVADLARELGFPDEDVLDAYFKAQPDPTGKPWPGILTHYRAAATHDAFFDFDRRENIYATLRILHHLHDLLLRVLLKSIGYDGPYQSPIPPLMQRDSVDWVTGSTPPGQLGFG